MWKLFPRFFRNAQKAAGFFFFFFVMSFQKGIQSSQIWWVQLRTTLSSSPQCCMWPRSPLIVVHVLSLYLNEPCGFYCIPTAGHQLLTKAFNSSEKRVISSELQIKKKQNYKNQIPHTRVWVGNSSFVHRCHSHTWCYVSGTVAIRILFNSFKVNPKQVHKISSADRSSNPDGRCYGGRCLNEIKA